MSRFLLCRPRMQRCNQFSRLEKATACAFPPSHNNLRRSFAELTQRQRAELEEKLVPSIAQNVIDPVLGKKISSLDWLSSRLAISDNGTVQLLLRLPSLLHPKLEFLKSTIRTRAEAELHAIKANSGTTFEHLTGVNVEAIASTPVPMMARLVEDADDVLNELGPGLGKVSHFLAVYSCKGGVGKSTIAVNLAYELARVGGRVGLLDLDIYGPSLPVLVNPPDQTIRRSEKGKGMVHPIEHEGVKLLSMGFVNTNSGVPGSGQNNGAAIMRGPLAVKVVAQLLKGTDWGELDVLILDLPPGTGDVQLAVCQDLAMSGAVAVSTPSKLAVTDTKKGIEMFTSLGVPTLAVVDNLSYFICDGGTKHYPFGRGSVYGENDNTPAVVQFPISLAANDANESGEPLCLGRPQMAGEELSAFSQLAATVSQELMRIQHGETETSEMINFADQDGLFAVSTVQASLDTTNSVFVVRLFGAEGAVQRKVNPAEFRARDPRTGDIIEDSPFKNNLSQKTEGSTGVHVERAATPSLNPNKIERKGRYGFSVIWGDGATIIYSKICIARAAGGQLQ